MHADRAAREPGRVTEMQAAIDAWVATLPAQIDPAVQSPPARERRSCPVFLQCRRWDLNPHALAGNGF
jgi:hypothetical protein